MLPTSLDEAVRWIPVLYLLALPASLLMQSPAKAWRLAGMAANTVLLLWLAATLHALRRLAQGDHGADMPGLLMALLISLLGWVIVRYSRRYLEGESGQGRYIASLMCVLAAVSVVATSHNLGIIAAAWIASSVALHRLLTFYPNRAAALVAAHKKFIVSRVADACLLVALLLLHRACGSLELAQIDAALREPGAMSASVQIALLLVALTAILKSAQLPFHGWILQVMEAPTPVSALLHAGVVNLGGFVLIRLAGPLSQAPGAQTALVLVGAGTALLAGLVMPTRISIKLRLAWSTCAQMGFMLMECGLGLYELAMLHLVAHSAYKAHAFLNAGDTVAGTAQRALLPAPAEATVASRLLVRLLALPLAIATLFVSAQLWQRGLGVAAPGTLALLIAGLGLAPLLHAGDSGRMSATLRGLLRLLGLAQCYLLAHSLFAGLLPLAPAGELPQLAAVAVTALLLLYGLQAWMQILPNSPFARTLYPWAYAGFYVDERFTRLTFQWWAPRMPQQPVTPPTLPSMSGEQA